MRVMVSEQAGHIDDLCEQDYQYVPAFRYESVTVVGCFCLGDDVRSDDFYLVLQFRHPPKGITLVTCLHQSLLILIWLTLFLGRIEVPTLPIRYSCLLNTL